MSDALELHRDGAIARLWLNRPDRLNALSSTLLAGLIDTAHRLNDDPAVRLVVIGGRGRCFCAGADLEGFPTTGGPEARAAADLGRRMADAIEGLQAVSIARLHGWCVGGGVVLAAACDLRVAEDAARFSIPEVDLGIPLAWGGIPRLVREIGPALTKELVMTCRPFSAGEGQRAGFLNRVVPGDGLDEAIDELADEVARRPTFPVRATKRHVDAITAAQVGLARSWSDADSLLTALGDPECDEARRAYLARRGDGQ